MHRLARVYFAVLGAALIVPTMVRAGDPPVSHTQAGSAPAMHRHGLFGKKYPTVAKTTRMPASMSPGMTMPDGAQIVGCAHSQNGVCASCKALLAMPGQVTTMTPPSVGGAAASSVAPGRAVASDSGGDSGFAVAEAGEPEPIGVMQANFQPARPMAGPAAAPAGMAMPSSAPTRAPILGDTGESRPHIFGHLFGFSAMARDMAEGREMKARRKREAHAAISYGSAAGNVTEIPASMVYGQKSR